MAGARLSAGAQPTGDHEVIKRLLQRHSSRAVLLITLYSYLQYIYCGRVRFQVYTMGNWH